MLRAEGHLARRQDETSHAVPGRTQFTVGTAYSLLPTMADPLPGGALGFMGPVAPGGAVLGLPAGGAAGWYFASQAIQMQAWMRRQDGCQRRNAVRRGGGTRCACTLRWRPPTV